MLIVVGCSFPCGRAISWAQFTRFPLFPLSCAWLGTKRLSQKNECARTDARNRFLVRPNKYLRLSLSVVYFPVWSRSPLSSVHALPAFFPAYLYVVRHQTTFAKTACAWTDVHNKWLVPPKKCLRLSLSVVFFPVVAQSLEPSSRASSFFPAKLYLARHQTTFAKTACSRADAHNKWLVPLKYSLRLSLWVIHFSVVA